MGKQLFANNATTTMSGTLAIGGTSFSLASGTGSLFPSISAGDYFEVTVYRKDAYGAWIDIETMKITNRVADVLTAGTRDYSGQVGVSGGRAYDGITNTVYVELLWTAESAEELQIYADTNASTLTNKTINLTSNTLVATSEQLRTALTDETGTGSAVFANSPELITPNIGAATGSVSGNAGSATVLQTGQTIDGVTFNGGANIVVVAPATNAATSKATPVDADEIPLADSAASWVLKKLTWANLKATAKAYFDTVYEPADATILKDADIGVTVEVAGAASVCAKKSADADVSMNNYKITTIKTATFNSQVALSTTTGAVTVDWTAAQNYVQNEPTGGITYTFTAPAGPCHLQLMVASDGTSTAQTITWPGTVIWMGATWAGVNNKKAVINFWYDGSNYFAMGANQV